MATIKLVQFNELFNVKVCLSENEYDSACKIFKAHNVRIASRQLKYMKEYEDTMWTIVYECGLHNASAIHEALKSI